MSGRWLGLYLPTMLLLGLCWGIGIWQIERDALARDTIDDSARLDRAERLLSDRLTATVGDLRFLSRTGEIEATLQDRSSATLDRAAVLLAALLQDKPRYAGVRLFDEQGQVLIRVRRTMNQVLRDHVDVPQRPQRHDAFDAARTLQPDTVYLSRFELEVDNGQLALPYRPLLRAALPLRRGDESALVLELEQDGGRLLGSLAEILSMANAQGMLFDDVGYWLYHPDETMRWGAQVGAGESMARRYPQSWSRMQGARGSLHIDESHWTYRPVFPLREVPGAVGPIADRGWWLALRHPPSDVSILERVLRSSWFWAAQALLLAASLLLAWRLTRIDRQRRNDEAALQAAEASTLAQRRVREQVYNLSLQVQPATSAEMFGDLLLSELAPLLKLSVAALYRLEGQWLTAVAGYGLPEGCGKRRFGVGASLVGEALADHRRIELDKLPTDYLEVRSALGHAPPARLLLVPLWLRAENLGVLELGLSAPLDASANEVLSQSLPLIALHLANYAHRRDAPG